MKAIYKKELRFYFTSITGYLFLALSLALVGLYHYLENMYAGYANFGYSLYGMRMFFVLLIPMVTMRLVAEEKKQKTDQMLLTAPVSITKIVIAKYGAVLSLFILVLAVCSIYPLIMTLYGTINLKLAYASIFGFFLLGAAYMAIGLFISALTESQALAAIITFLIVLITSLSTGIGSIMPTDSRTGWLFLALLYLGCVVISYMIMNNKIISFCLGCLGEILLFVFYLFRPEVFERAVQKFFDCFYIIGRYDDFIIGVFNLTNVVYYLSISILFVFLTIQGIKKRRWS